MFAGFPMLALPVVVYNLLAFFGGEGRLPGQLLQRTPPLQVASGAAISLTLSDLILALAIGAFFVEVLKAITLAKPHVGLHIWSALVLFVCGLELLLLRDFATPTFALITLMALLNVFAGLVLTAARVTRAIDRPFNSLT